MKNIFLFLPVLVLAGCLGNPIEPRKVFEKSEPLSPYFIANKYFKIMERCWINADPDFAKYYRLETFPPASLGEYNISRISLVLEPIPALHTSPPKILSMNIEALRADGYLNSDRDLIDSSYIKVFVNDNIYPKESLRWLDLKRWANGDEECAPSKANFTRNGTSLI